MKKQHHNVAALTFFTLAAIIIGILVQPKETESLPAPLPHYETIPLPVIEAVATATVPLQVKKAVPKVSSISTSSTPELPPTLKRICSCESNGNPNGEPKQFNSDGTVVKGKINPLDTGMCQINLKYHQATAERLDYDLFTEYGNASYAIYLYETQGTTPWNWSRSCWQ